jgi:hypothetical protein
VSQVYYSESYGQALQVEIWELRFGGNLNFKS